MDRFKFRVRFKCLKCGNLFTELYQFGNPFYDYAIRCECDKFIRYSTDIDLISIEQCTGLKDKHGKLIFEWDIVEWISGGEIKRHKVAFRGNGFVLIDKSNLTDGLVWSPLSKSVIGNIHENPELLDIK
jgi:uncharacterized phage protein (TIGR01671 family)